MKIDRLLGILMMLVNKKKVTARQLSEYFDVTVRTIQRDMERFTGCNDDNIVQILSGI